MSTQQLLRIVVALALALVLWAGLSVFRHGARDAAGHFAMPRVTPAQVDTVRIWRKTDSTLVVKSDSVWRVNGNVAAKNEVADFFAAMADTAAPSELISENPKSEEGMGIDSVGGRRLRIVGGGKVLADLTLGNRGPDFEGYYIRKTGDSRVYLQRGRLASVVDRGPDEWRDKRIAQIPSESIATIEIRRPKSSYALKRRGGTFTFASGAPVDSMALANMLAAYRYVHATGFPHFTHADSVHIATPDRHALLKDAAGKPLLAMVFDSAPGGFYVRHDTGSTWYRIDLRGDDMTPADSVVRGKKAGKGKASAPRR